MHPRAKSQSPDPENLGFYALLHGLMGWWARIAISTKYKTSGRKTYSTPFGYHSPSHDSEELGLNTMGILVCQRLSLCTGAMGRRSWGQTKMVGCAPGTCAGKGPFNAQNFAGRSGVTGLCFIRLVKIQYTRLRRNDLFF